MKNESLQNSALKYGGIAVLAFGAWFLGRRFVREFKKDGAENALSTDLSAQQAQSLRTAFNPSGNAWMMSFDTTDTAKVMALAKEIKDYKKVAQYYKDLYKSSLADDLGTELSATDLAKFWAIVNHKPAEAKPKIVKPKDGNFKFKLGDKLIAVPLKGNSKVGYAIISNRVLKIVAWHSLPNTYLGTVSGFVKVKVKDYDGKEKYLSAYYVKDLPNGQKLSSSRVFVLEREVALQK